ncbi:MAG: glutamine--tRNA ligase, partial [Clostridia bacterium]|nr:glutamine--tRNA ligase [Clostridia bacterium]
LYDWVLDSLEGCKFFKSRPQQIEFARLNLTNTIMSKRYLRQLVEEGFVEGWDDPRMPTISGLRRRGYTPEAIRDFCDRIGVAKSNSMVDVAMLEHCIREDLNYKAPRVMAVLKALKVVITNYPEKKVEDLDAEINPENPEMGSRKIPFSRVVYIEQDDFRENPPKKYFRLAPGKEVRLKHAYIIKCENVIKDDKGEIVEIQCTYDPATKSGEDTSGKKVKGTLHWVSAAHALEAEVRLYDYLLADKGEDGEDKKDFTQNLNSNSLEKLPNCFVEPSLKEARPGEKYQFLRQGYFCADKESTGARLIFNRIVSLRDSWSKIEQKL